MDKWPNDSVRALCPKPEPSRQNCRHFGPFVTEGLDIRKLAKRFCLWFWHLILDLVFQVWQGEETLTQGCRNRLLLENMACDIVRKALSLIHTRNFLPMKHEIFHEFLFHVCERSWNLRRNCVSSNKNFSCNKFHPDPFYFMFHETLLLSLDATKSAPQVTRAILSPPLWEFGEFKLSRWGNVKQFHHVWTRCFMKSPFRK